MATPLGDLKGWFSQSLHRQFPPNSPNLHLLPPICATNKMTNRISNWIRNRSFGRRKRSKKDTDNGPETLFLPATRPRPITPNNASSSNLKFIRPNGIFFELPPELRTEIITEAFGYRGVHMGIEFDHALTRSPSCHCKIPGSSKPTRVVARDTSIPKAWRWKSRVCDYTVPYEEWQGWQTYKDYCLSDMKPCCDR